MTNSEAAADALPGGDHAEGHGGGRRVGARAPVVRPWSWSLNGERDLVSENPKRYVLRSIEAAALICALDHVHPLFRPRTHTTSRVASFRFEWNDEELSPRASPPHPGAEAGGETTPARRQHRTAGRRARTG